MTCVHMGGAMVMIADQSEPFMHNGKRFCVDKRWGPFQSTKLGDPIRNQPSGRTLQAAYDHYEKNIA